MKQNLHITIPKPCHESWATMDPTSRGAFCHSCQKGVIDFSAMTDREVIEYLQKHTAGCGRFRKDQLDTKLSISEVDNGAFKWKALLLGLLPLLVAKSYGTVPFIKAPIGYNTTPRMEAIDTIQIHTDDSIIYVSGKVLDEKQEPVISAAVLFLDSMGNRSGIGIVTDADGRFSIAVNKSQIRENQHMLKISSLGYHTMQIPITTDPNQSYTIELLTNVITSNQMIVNGFIVTNTTPAKRIKRWFRRTFSKQ